MKPTGFLRYSYYKGVRQLGVKRSVEGKYFRRDKQWNRIMKRSEKQSFKIFMNDCLFDY
ncbi:hypothetical protein ACR77X_13920 [Bacteroides salyersiae]|uniref:hypothetical protein n=1 Tax=Bacteroides salyersiae TaxID=291644 RepID=UPI003DA6BF47